MRVEGVPHLRRRLSRPTWAEKPAGIFLTNWSNHVRRRAAALAPKFSGGLAASIQSEKDSAAMPRWARVFSNHPGAMPMEKGTRPFWPPAAALREWSHAHGISEYAVQAGIAKRGLAPRRYFERAEKEADARLNGWLAQMASQIESMGNSE